MREVAAADTLPQAEFLCALLREQGIAASVGTDAVGEVYALARPVPVLVPEAQEQEALRFLARANLAAPEPPPADAPPAEEATAPAHADDGSPAAFPPAPVETRPGALVAEVLGVLFVLVGWTYAYEILHALDTFPEFEWTPQQTTVNAAIRMAQALVLLWLVRLWRGEPATEFGLVRPRGSDLGIAVVALGLGFLATLLHSWAWGMQWHPPQGGPQLGTTPGIVTWTLFGLAFDAVYEEAVFRGYAIGRLQKAGVPGVLAAVFAAVPFAAAHAYQGWVGVTSAAIFGLLWGFLYLRVRRVAPLALGHAAMNVVLTGW